MPALQNFPIDAGDDLDVTFKLDPTDGISLDGATVNWRAYGQNSGSVTSLVPVIVKSTSDGIAIPTSPANEFVVTINAADSIPLLGNYYHAAQIIDEGGNTATVVAGIMTVRAAPINYNLEGDSPND